MISGEAFRVLLSLESGKILDQFINDLLMCADAVILFRSSPKEKADTVKLIKKFHNGNKTVMSVGDGFNDVNMI